MRERRLDGQQRTSFARTSELAGSTEDSVGDLLSGRHQVERPPSSPGSPSRRAAGFGRSDLHGLGRNSPVHHGLSGGAVLPVAESDLVPTNQAKGFGRGGSDLPGSGNPKNTGGLATVSDLIGHDTLQALNWATIAPGRPRTRPR